MYCVGDIVYVCNGGLGWFRAVIIRRSGNYYHVRLLDRHNCAYGVSEHRILSEAEYMALRNKDDTLPPRPPLLH